MTPDSATPLDDRLLESLISADAAMTVAVGPQAFVDESWLDECFRLIEQVWPLGNAPRPGPGSGPPLSFGRFEVVRELGRGGFGVVYLARDRFLGRDVALKVPRPETAITAAGRRRCMREARATAVLDHPNIMPVYEADELGPVTYIASAYCEGPSLSAWLKAQHEAVPPRSAARLVAALAGAVQHAHDRGILHRDLKPGNVMLQPAAAAGPGDAGLDGFVPRVTDFGLAKLTGDDSDDSRSGMPLGSPPYMAPEQAAGRRRDLGPPTDVYALGATLFELLTGRAPFRGETPAETIRQVIDNDPIAPRVLRPNVPRDLETIALRCLNKDITRRYPTAAALADDLERFLAGQPIHARPASAWERCLKWARRQPAQAALVGLAMIVATAGSGGIAWSNAWLRAHNERLRSERNRTEGHARDSERHQKLAEEREALADRHLHAAQLHMASQAADVGQFERAQEVLLDDVYGPGPTHRDFAWWHLWRQSRREIALLGRHDAPVRRVDLSPDGSTLASCDAAGAIILWDPLSGRARASLSAHGGAADWLVYSPDGRMLASAGDCDPTSSKNKEILVWDVRRGGLLARPEGTITGEIRVIMFMDAGRLLAVVSRDERESRTVRVWDLDSDRSRPRLRYVVGGFGFVMLSPDGRFLAAREGDGRLTIRNAADGRISRIVATELADAKALAISSDGRYLAAAATPSRVFVWDLSGEIEPRIFSDDGPAADRLVFSPDGKALLAIAGGKRVSLRDLQTGRQRVIVSLDPVRVGSFNLTFSPDGSQLALYGSGQPGGMVPTSLYEVATGTPQRNFPGRRTFQYMSFAPDGKSLFLGGDHDLSIWRLQPAQEFDTFVDHHAEVWAAAFSPDGRTVASGGDDDTLRLWEPETGRERASVTAHKATVSSLAFRPDGRVIASGSLERGNNLKLWDAVTLRQIAQLSGHPEPVRSVAFSPDGRILASAGSDRQILLWDGATGAPLDVLVGHEDKVRRIAFAPDGLTLASASNDRTVRLWDTRTRQPSAALKGRYPVSSIAFSADGQMLASADENGYITVWDPTMRAPRLVINADDTEVRALAFSPDGGTLASAGVAPTIRLWDCVTGQELLTLNGPFHEVNALAFSPDGGTLISADHQGRVRLYRGDPDRSASPHSKHELARGLWQLK
jgi:eukaryotic-like serine/threonine-protein kinase